MEQKLLGNIHHIRAVWHGNDTWPRMLDGVPMEKDGSVQWNDRWREPIPPVDLRMNYAKHGYESLEELCWWKLYERTGGGLMTEMGSHLLDACHIFLGELLPLSVQGTGGMFLGHDDRENEDHVFATFEFPGHSHPLGRHEGDNVNDVAVVTCSCISSNSMESYGEQLMGSRGTMIIESEDNVMLFKETGPGEKTAAAATEISVATDRLDQPVMVASESRSPATAAAGWARTTSAELANHGYGEQLEHLAWCIRNPDPVNQPRCDPSVALANAVCALMANLAIRRRQRIEFKPEWFDIDSEEMPETE